MTLDEIRVILQAKGVVAGDVDKDIEMACGFDLVSDVLAFTKSDSLLLTGLTNQQAVRTADIADVAAICFVRGKRPNAETIALARGKGIPLLATRLLMYEACGRLYEKGLGGCSQSGDED